MSAVEIRGRTTNNEGSVPVAEVRVRKRDLFMEAIRSFGERVAKVFRINLKERQIDQVHKNAERIRNNQEERKAANRHKEEEGSLLHLKTKKSLSTSQADAELRRAFETLASLRARSQEPLPQEISDEMKEEKSVFEKAVEVISDPIGSAQQVAQVVQEKLPTPEEILESGGNLFEAVEEFVENPQATLKKVDEYIENELPSPDQVLERIGNGVVSAVPVFLTQEEVEENLAKASEGRALQEARTANYAAMTEEEKESLSMKDRGMLTGATQAYLQAKEAERLRKLDGHWTPDHMRFQNTAFARGAELAPYIQARRGELIQRILTKSSLYTLEELKAMELEELEAVLRDCESVDEVIERFADVIETAGNVLQHWIEDPQEAEVREEGEQKALPTAPERKHRPVAPVQTAEGPSVPKRRRVPHEEKENG